VETIHTNEQPTEPYQAVVAGHICLDVIPEMSGSAGRRLDEILAPGHLTVVGPAALSTGGAVSNTGLALNILGIPTRLMGKIGDDLFGRAVQGIVNRYGPGLAEGMIVDPADSTSYTLIVNPPNIDRIFLHCPGANDTFRASDVRYDLVGQARLFHFGYPPLMARMYQDRGRELVDILSRVKTLGVTVSLDMSHIDPNAEAGKADWRGILTSALPYVDLFLPSIEELLAALHPNTYTSLIRRSRDGSILPCVTTELLSDLSRELLDLGVKVAVIKLGDRGLYLRTAGREAIAGIGRAAPADPSAWADKELWAPCFKVNVVGTTGSGDSSIAGFLSALLRGLGPEEAAMAAVAVGACNVEAPDALSGLRSWEQTLKRAASGWERLSFEMPETTWKYNEAAGFWLP
jgi:sugar/nucleoside kinase (ribokinase family)